MWNTEQFVLFWFLRSEGIHCKDVTTYVLTRDIKRCLTGEFQVTRQVETSQTFVLGQTLFLLVCVCEGWKQFQ